MLRTGGGVIQTAGYAVHGSRLAVFVLQHDAVKAVHNALRAVLQAGCMITQSSAPAQRFNAVDFHGVVEEAGK